MCKTITIQFSVSQNFEKKYEVDDSFILSSIKTQKAMIELSFYLGREILYDLDEISDKEPEIGDVTFEYVNINCIEVMNANNEIEKQIIDTEN